jgi:hypothetical protein
VAPTSETANLPAGTFETTGYVYDVSPSTRQRFDTETGLGSLRDPNHIPKARDSYQAMYYDLANRLTASVMLRLRRSSLLSRPFRRSALAILW